MLLYGEPSVFSPDDGSEPQDHLAWYQSYSDDELADLIGEPGFSRDSVEFQPNLVDTNDPPLLQFVTAVRA